MYPVELSSKRTSKSAAFLLFLIGMFSMTQINLGGRLGIAELFMVACAPFVFIKNIPILRKDGVLYYFVFILLWIVGAIVTDTLKGNYLLFALKGIAVPITVFANVVCVYVLLRKDYDNLKWFMLGVALSGVVSIFIFQRGGSAQIAEEQGLEAGAEAIMGYKLFWTNQLTAWLGLPIVGWYRKTSKTYAVAILLFLCVFNLFSGGRSMFLIASFSVLLIVFGGKERRSLVFIKRHIVLMILSLGIVGVTVSSTYKYMVRQGYMGEAETIKYEQQTSRGSGILNLLMAGRGDFFIGLIAALDKPIMGHGSVAIDDHGYILDFLTKYGSIEDYKRLVKIREKYGVRIIPAHSHIINYWMWHGIFALIFWCCTIYLAVKTLLRRMHIYPPWYGYLAIYLPLFCWDVLFSPFGMRVSEAALFSVFLLLSKLERDQKRGLVPIVE